MGHVMFMRKGNVHTVPSLLTELAYIQSNGTQYIDTGFVPNQNTRVVCTAVFKANSGGTNWMFGARVDSSSLSKAFAFCCTSTGTAYQAQYGTKTANLSNTLSSVKTALAGNVTVFELDKRVPKIGSASGSITASTFTSPCSLTLFGVNREGNVICGTVTLYSCQIYDNDTLVRDFVPCIYGNAVGLWDKVEEKFYGNAGTGVFIGSEVA